MKALKEHQIQLSGRQVTYRLRSTTTARKIRVRVGPNGVEVVLPPGRKSEDVFAFLEQRKKWIIDQLERVDRMGGIRRPEQRQLARLRFSESHKGARREDKDTSAR